MHCSVFPLACLNLMTKAQPLLLVTIILADYRKAGLVALTALRIKIQTLLTDSAILHPNPSRPVAFCFSSLCTMLFVTWVTSVRPSKFSWDHRFQERFFDPCCPTLPNWIKCPFYMLIYYHCLFTSIFSALTLKGKVWWSWTFATISPGHSI